MGWKEAEACHSHAIWASLSTGQVVDTEEKHEKSWPFKESWAPRLQDRRLMPPQLRRWRLRDARLTASGLEVLASHLPPHTEMLDVSRNDCGRAVGLLAKRMEEGPLGSHWRFGRISFSSRLKT